MAAFRNISRLGVLALMAVLLSYSFDLECLIETQGCAQTVVHAERLSDCTQPGLAPTPAPVAVLTSPPRFRLPLPRVVSVPAIAWALGDSPPQTSRSVPLGLRAPPRA